MEKNESSTSLFVRLVLMWLSRLTCQYHLLDLPTYVDTDTHNLVSNVTGRHGLSMKDEWDEVSIPALRHLHLAHTTIKHDMSDKHSSSPTSTSA